MTCKKPQYPPGDPRRAEQDERDRRNARDFPAFVALVVGGLVAFLYLVR